jgi:hypothetical protein
MAQILIQEVLKLSAPRTMKSRYGKRSKYFYLIRKEGRPPLICHYLALFFPFLLFRNSSKNRRRMSLKIGF